ncbi:sun domain-containing protein 1-like isoform X2 [Leptidea sinapis]|uniref:sun domain-containing protein 1-like isoform X2 n=1 Tax=Leptidea sinapis TaxID=189913 RepID=UPI0021C30824|nr:sun domain-containing protein 1-like isoform X2 [Leptidea sinapis]
MVMLTRSAFKKSFDSLSSDISERNVNPPWCSAGRERRTPRIYTPARQFKSSHQIRENIWEYLNNEYPNRKKNKTCSKIRAKNNKNHYMWYFFLSVIVITILFLSLNKAMKDDLLQTLYEKANLISWVDSGNFRLEQECCNRMQHLSLALAREKYFVRNTIHTRRTQCYRTETNRNKSSYIEGCIAVKGSDTTEWGGHVGLWGILPLWFAAPPPHTILALRNPTPSDCWPFRGSTGEVIIHFPRKATITSISLEHIRPDTTRSAPNHFIVYGILDNGTRINAAEGVYQYNKPAKQYFSLDNNNSPLQSIVFRVLSNHGNPKYTCLYRVHVYGVT